jgi:hypothetical protein
MPLWGLKYMQICNNFFYFVKASFKRVIVWLDFGYDVGTQTLAFLCLG